MLKTEHNIYNLQLVLWTLPTLSPHNCHWSEVDFNTREALLRCALNCLKEHTDLNILTTCIKSLGFVALVHATRDQNVGCDIISGICDFIRNMLSNISKVGDNIATPSSQSSQTQQPTNTTTSIPTPSSSARSNAARRVQNMYKFTHKATSTTSTTGFSLTNSEIVYLIDISFQTVLEWVRGMMSSQFLHVYGWVLRDVHDTAVYFIATVSKHIGMSLSLSCAVCKVVDFLLVQCGHFPGNNPGHYTSLADTSTFPDHATANGCWTCGIPSLRHLDNCCCEQVEDALTHYIIDGEIIISVAESRCYEKESGMDIPKNGSNSASSVVVFVRSKYGKYTFETSSLISTQISESVSFDGPDAGHVHSVIDFDMPRCPKIVDGLHTIFSWANENNDLLLPMVVIGQEGTIDPCAPLMNTGSHMSSMLNISSIELGLLSSLQLSDPLCDPFLTRLSRQRDVEDDKMKTMIDKTFSSRGYSSDLREDSSKLFVKPRLMLSQFGLAGFHCHGQVMELENCPSLHEKLSALDDVQCREQYSAWCVFTTNIVDASGERIVVSTSPVVAGEEEKSQFSSHYRQFLLGLGWLVDTDFHQGCFLYHKFHCVL